MTGLTRCSIVVMKICHDSIYQLYNDHARFVDLRQVVKKACYSTKSLSLNIFVTQRNKTNQVWHKSTSTS